MTTLRQAAEQALEALIDAARHMHPAFVQHAAIQTLRQALEAEQQAEPVYWEHRVPVVGEFGQTVGYSKWKPGKGLSHWPHRALYEHPQPAAQWVGLTDEDRRAVFESLPNALDGFLKLWGWLHFSKAVEAKLREKNSGAQARKPLTDARVAAIVANYCLNVGDWTRNGESVARAIERAHGIGGEA